MERTKTGMGIKLTLEERNILETAVILGDPVGSVKLSLWEKYGRRRLYVAFTNEETYFDLNDDNDLEINLRGDTEVMDAIEEFITNFLDLEADMEAIIVAEETPEPTPEFSLADDSSEPFAWMTENVDAGDLAGIDIENYVREFAAVHINALHAEGEEVILSSWVESDEFAEVVAYIRDWVAEESQETTHANDDAPPTAYVQSWSSHVEYVLDDGRRIVEIEQPGGIIRRVWGDNVGDPYDYMHEDESTDWREMTPEEVDDLLPSVE